MLELLTDEHALIIWREMEANRSHWLKLDREDRKEKTPRAFDLAEDYDKAIQRKIQRGIIASQQAKKEIKNKSQNLPLKGKSRPQNQRKDNGGTNSIK